MVLRMLFARFSYGFCMVIAWLLHGYCMIIASWLFMVIALLLHSFCTDSEMGRGKVKTSGEGVAEDSRGGERKEKQKETETKKEKKMKPKQKETKRKAEEDAINNQVSHC